MNVPKKLVFVSDKSFQYSLLFVSKDGAYLSVAPFRFSYLGQEKTVGKNTLAYSKHSQNYGH